MASELILTPDAARDIEEAVEYYELQRAGLGARFFAAVTTCPEGVVRTPEMHRVIEDDIRRALVRKFPYAIFYDSDADTVTVYCVIHTSRNPEDWRRRVRPDGS